MPGATSTVIPVSLPRSLAREVDKLALKRHMTRSELFRDSIRRQVAFARLDDVRDEFAKKAQRAGVRTLQDAVRLVRSVRKELHEEARRS